MENDNKIYIPTDLPYDLVLLTEQEFSYITGQKLATVRANRIKGGGCWFYKIGGLVRYKLSDVVEYVDKCKRNSTSA